MGETGRTTACPDCKKPCLRGSKFCAHCGTLLSGLELELVDPDGPDGPDRDPPLPPGTLVGSYRLASVLGEGGMGRVYVAEHIKLGRRVAVKRLRKELASNPGTVARFFAEARAVNRIFHENIVEITDIIEQPGGDNCIIMELLKGEDLAHRLQRARTLPLVRAFGIASQIASALSAVHAAGIIHRDLKPDNIFLIERAGNPDFVKVLDFGVAKLTGADDRGGIAMHTTVAGQIVGTPEYMSPEQARGEPIDLRADIYALGVIVYEMITGGLPFQARNFGELMIKHMTVSVELPSRQPGLSPGLQLGRDQLLLDLLAKDPADRPASMAEVDRRLRELVDAMMRSSTPRSSTEPIPRTGAEPAAMAGAEAVAKLALRRRSSPLAAVEIATPRSVSRIDVLTPASIDLGSIAKPLIPPAMSPAPATSPLPGIPAMPGTPGTPGMPAAPVTQAATPKPAPALRDLPPLAAQALLTPERLAKSSSDVHPLAKPSPAGGAGPERAEVAGARIAAVTTAPVADAPDEASHPLRPGVSPQPAIRRWRRVVLGAVVIVAVVVALAAAIVALRLGRPSDAPPGAAVQPSEVKIKFVSAPPGAEVRLAGTGELLGITPFIWSFARGERPVTVEIEKPGFATVTQRIPLVGDDAVAVALAPAVVVTPTAPPVPAAPPAWPNAPNAPNTERPHAVVPAKRALPPPDQPLDRNGTMDVFKEQ